MFSPSTERGGGRVYTWIFFVKIMEMANTLGTKPHCRFPANYIGYAFPRSLCQCHASRSGTERTSATELFLLRSKRIGDNRRRGRDVYPA